MEIIERPYLKDPDFLFAAKNAQPYPLPQITPIPTPRPPIKLWQIGLGILVLCAIGYGVNRFVLKKVEKNRRKDQYL